MSHLRVGAVDCDTSHCFQFARRLNHVGIEPSQWVDGARVELAYKGESRITAPERVEMCVREVSAAGVSFVDEMESLLGRVDAVFVHSNEGAVHRERSEPFLKAGLPVFIDKPLAVTVDDAVAQVNLARQHSACLISGSALRWSRPVRQAAEASGDDPIRGVDVFAPAPLNPLNPGLFHYGVHGVEMLYALMGAGCRSVACAYEEDCEVVVGHWRDGRLGVLRAIHGPARDYGLTIHRAGGIQQEVLDTASIYKDLLDAVVPALKEGRWLVAPEELVEVVAFQEAALRSKAEGGRPVEVSYGD